MNTNLLGKLLLLLLLLERSKLLVHLALDIVGKLLNLLTIDAVFSLDELDGLVDLTLEFVEALQLLKKISE
jgi:hypothetical protein